MISRLLLVLSSLSLVSAEATRQWHLSHSILPGPFLPRGEIIMTVSDQGEATAITIEQEKGQALQIDDKAVDLDTAYYQLQLTPVDGGDPVVTTVPLCQVRRSNYRDIISIAISGTGHALSLSYQPMVSPLAPPTCSELQWNNEASFDSKVELEHAVPGMTLRTVLPHYQPPPGLKILAGKRSNASGGPTSANYLLTGQDQQQQQQQDAGMFGFFKRYWYIIVPLMLINLFAAPPPPEQEGQAAGSGATQAAAAAGAAAAGAAAAGVGSGASGAPRQRRTKRG